MSRAISRHARFVERDAPTCGVLLFQKELRTNYDVQPFSRTDAHAAVNVCPKRLDHTRPADALPVLEVNQHGQPRGVGVEPAGEHVPGTVKTVTQHLQLRAAHSPPPTRILDGAEVVPA